MVPFKRTALYKLVKRFNFGELSANTTWTELSKHCRRPLLSRKNLSAFVEKIKLETEGGLAISSSEIKVEIKNEIVKQ